jgi:sterol desaturase/sphingolipid hydroxylase (fatty acid hydroxylase superfamily)
VKLTKLGYFAEFFLFPPIVLLSAALAFYGPTRPDPAIWAIVLVAGVVVWTFVEYWLHRVVFHHAPLVSRLHDLHHEDPRELIGTPAWGSLLSGLVLFALPAWALLGFGLATAAITGLAVGYLWFVFVHYAIHQWQPRHGSYLYRARLRHAQHHYVSHGGNFGVTTGVWDHVFGTALEVRRPARAAQRETELSAH